MFPVVRVSNNSASMYTRALHARQRSPEVYKNRAERFMHFIIIDLHYVGSEPKFSFNNTGGGGGPALLYPQTTPVRRVCSHRTVCIHNARRFASVYSNNVIARW